MLRKITLLLSASILAHNPTLHVRSRSSNVGPTTVLQLLKRYSVGPMFGQCQHANNDLLPVTPTISQRWLNDCLLSGHKEGNTWNFRKRYWIKHYYSISQEIHISNFSKEM